MGKAVEIHKPCLSCNDNSCFFNPSSMGVEYTKSLKQEIGYTIELYWRQLAFNKATIAADELQTMLEHHGVCEDIIQSAFELGFIISQTPLYSGNKIKSLPPHE